MAQGFPVWALFMVWASLPAYGVVVEQPVFSQKSFQQAKVEAEQTNRLLIVTLRNLGDSYRSGGTERLDKSWRDAKVAAWLAENAIVVDLRWEHSQSITGPVEELPCTIVYTGGKEFDRVYGYRSPERLIAWLTGCQRGETEVPGGHVNVRKRRDRASALAKGAGTQLDEAAEEYAWLWENMLKHSAHTDATRISFMAGEMKTLAAKYPPARERFRAIRDATEKRLVDKTATMDDLTDWIELNRIVQDPEKTLEWYDRVKDDPGAKRSIERNKSRLVRLFMGQDRLADAGKYMDPPLFGVQMEFANIAMGAAMKDADRATVERATADAVARASKDYGALLAAGRDREATAVADTVLRAADTPQARIALVSWALKAGSPRPEHLKWLDEAEAKGADVAALRERVKAVMEKR